MKKLIKLDFNNTTRERKTEDSYSELYSHDKNNGSFEFEILNETLTTEQVTALFKFTESNKIWKTTGTVEGNKVKVTFDTTLITQNETVICYLYFDEEQRTSDTFRFKFKVKVSEIDKMSRYEVKERFINNTVIVDRLDVVTKDELKEALKNVGGITTEGLLTEVKAEEIYAKKSEAVDNTNFELVKNRILALELKTDKDTVYDDSEVKERLTTLENKTSVDLSNYATKQELANVSGSQPLADNLVTKEDLENKHYISDVSNLATKDELQEVRNSQPVVDTSNLVTRDELDGKGYLTTHQDLSEYAKKSELYNDSDLKARVEVLEQKTDKDTVYDDTPLKERVMALESRAIEGGTYDDKPIRDRLDVLEAKEDKDTKYDDTEVKNRLTELESKPVVDTSVFVTDEKLNSKGYLTEHQDLTPYALKSEIPQPYNDTPLNERITALENKPTTGGSVDTSNFVTKEELKEKEDNIFEVINRDPLYKVYEENTITEHLKGEEGYGVGNVDGRGGTIYSNASRTSADIFKGDINKEKFVDFQTAMFTVANSIPDDYHLYDLMYAGGEDRKVLFLSNKNFSEVVPKEELKAIIREVGGTESAGSNIDTSNLATKEELAKAVTKEELETKHYVTEEELNNKAYLTTHQSLDNVVTKEELATKGYISDVSNLVTKEELESKNYLTTPYNDTPLKERVEVLENKVDKDTIYNDEEVKQRLTVLESKPAVDTSNFITIETLDSKNYLTTTVAEETYAKKSEIPQPYSDTELVKRITVLENKQDNDTIYNDTDLRNRIGELKYDVEYNVNSLKKSVEDLEYKLRDYDSRISNLDSTISYSATKNELYDYVKRTELPAPYDDTELRNSLYSVENELRNKENEFNSRFVSKDDLRTLVTEIVSQLKSENN